MNLPRAFGTIASLAAIVTAFLAYASHPARGSDHQDSNTMINRPSADITDVFVFPAANPANVVLAMDTHPLIPPGMGAQTSFDPAVVYQFKIVHTQAPYQPGAAGNNAPEDMVIQFGVSGTGPGQTITMYGPAKPNTGGTGTVTTFVTPTGNVPYNQATTLKGNIQVFAGPRSDPFFFDLAQFFQILPDRDYRTHQGTPPTPAPTVSSFRGFVAGNAQGCPLTPANSQPAQDFFSANGYNVLAIVVELPRSLLAPSGTGQVIHVWATTATATGS